MRVVYAIPVRHIETLADGTFMAVGIESGALVPPEYPATLGIHLLICLAADPQEAQPDRHHTLRMRVLGPDLVEVGASLEIPFQIAPRPSSPAGWEVRTPLALALNFEAAEAGTYSVEIAANDASISVPLLVLSQPPH